MEVMVPALPSKAPLGGAPVGPVGPRVRAGGRAQPAPRGPRGARRDQGGRAGSRAGGGRSPPRADPHPLRRRRGWGAGQGRAGPGAAEPRGAQPRGAERSAPREEFSQNGTDGKARELPIPGGML